MPGTTRSAYTLIELILVIALLGIASALLVPRLIGLETLTAQAAVRKLIADLSFAQSDALAQQELRRVTFFDDGSGYAIIRSPTSSFADFDDPFDPATAVYIEDPLATGADLGRYVVDYGEDDRFEGVTISAVDIDGGNRFVTYDALGGTVAGGSVPGTGGQIELMFDTAVFQITISPFTGKLTVVSVP